MITFNYETAFILKDENKISNWVENIISNHDFEVGDINYIFCDDEYLHKLNVEFLQHDTLTDIISFDNTLGKLIAGDIFHTANPSAQAQSSWYTFSSDVYRRFPSLQVIVIGANHDSARRLQAPKALLSSRP